MRLSMKTVLSVLCWLGIVVMLTGCDNGDDNSGTAGGRGDWPEVSFAVGDDGTVICYNADTNVITTNQTCTWNCAIYATNNPTNAPRKVVLRFDEALVCRETGKETVVDPITMEETEKITETCENEVALVKEDFYMCVLK
jgi:hypothetical protein